MRGRLWSLRLTLLLVVSALVFSPLAVRGASISSQPVGWNHDPSTLLLPSSPTYPAVVAYRDIRMRMADRSFEKSELLLGFANEDAASINTMARRQDFVASAGHSSDYQNTFDCCVGWLVIANERGNDVSYLLARIKNDHMAQQTALSQALESMPEWSHEAIEAARTHAATVLLEAVDLLEGSEAAGDYRDMMAASLPDLTLPEEAPAPAPPAVVVVSPEEENTVESDPAASGEDESTPPEILSFSADKSRVGFGDEVNIQCSLAAHTGELSLSWWCSRGKLVASGAEATWTAPSKAGVCEINVTVTDADGNRDSDSLEIRVKADESDAGSSDDDGVGRTDDDSSASPDILSLDFSADHKYFEESGAGSYAILIGRSCTIECVVDEPRDIDFDWDVDGGADIDGSGDTVVVTAPSSPGYVTITVTTTNSRGDTDSATATLYVSTCTYCF